MFRRILCVAVVPALLAGCGKDDESDPIITTATPASIDGVLDTLPACETIAADGRINVVSGCADNACVGMTYEDISEVMGDEGACEPVEDGSPTLRCSWEGLIEIEFTDLDADFEPDKGDMATAIRVHGEYAGGTPEGLGISASSACFLEQFEDPDLATWQLVYDHYVLVEASWIGWGITVIDNDGPPGELDPDGVVDVIILEGAR